MNHSSLTTSPSESRGSTRCFWLGYLIGGLVGLGFGLWIGDAIGWTYMGGTVGCIAALPFEKPDR